MVKTPFVKWVIRRKLISLKRFVVIGEARGERVIVTMEYTTGLMHSLRNIVREHNKGRGK
jgi:hypothetical protein